MAPIKVLILTFNILQNGPIPMFMSGEGLTLHSSVVAITMADTQLYNPQHILTPDRLTASPKTT